MSIGIRQHGQLGQSKAIATSATTIVIGRRRAKATRFIFQRKCDGQSFLWDIATFQ